jgi:hypothetical protein
MKRQLKAATLSLVALIGTASVAGATTEFNIYGASAQGDFWIAEATNFMHHSAAVDGLGCGTTVPASGSASSFKITFNNTTAAPATPANHGNGEIVNYGYATGSGCNTTLVGSDGNVIIRTAGIASGEGALAVNGNNPLDSDLNLAGNTGTATCANGYRLMANGSGFTAGNFWGASNKASELSCYKVHVGTTDLDVANIDQGAFTASDLNTQYPLPADMLGSGSGNTDFTTNLTYQESLAVPFQFIVNDSVTAQYCYDNGVRMAEYFCSNVDQCGVNPVTGHTRTCGSAETIENLSRLQAVLLFSGQVPNWQYFHPTFPNQKVSVFLRVPGSGTHAALEKTVINGGNTGWGNSIFGYNNPAGTPSINYIATSDNMMDSVQATLYSVGYVDADKDPKTTHDNVRKLAYQGVWPSAANVRNGKYDFYTVSRMYTNTTTLGTGFESTIATQLKAFVLDPRNIPGVNVVSGAGTAVSPWTWSISAGLQKATFWNSVTSMKYLRADALSYPAINGARQYVVLP